MNRWLYVAALLLCALCGCDEEKAPAPAGSGSATPEKATQLKVGIAIPSYAHAVAWIGADGGHFAKQRIDPEVTVTGGSAAAMRTLIAKRIDVALAGGDAVLKANAAGAELVVLGSLVSRFYHRLIVQKSINGADDLKGKTIGLPFLGGPQDMAVKYALGELGLKYDEDVKIVSLGKEFNRLAALSKGEIHGTTSQTPESKLDELGLKVLVDLPAKPVSFPYMVIAVRKDYVAEHRGELERFVAGLCGATQFYKHADNQKRSLAIIAEHLSNADTKGAAEERYRLGGPSLLSYPPTADRKAFETVVTLMDKPELKKQLDGMFDGSVLAAAQKSGACKAAN